MTSAPKPGSAPLALQLEVEFLDRLSEPVREGKAASVSAIIRAALERFDLSNVVVVHPAQLQISVRLPLSVRRTLQKVARVRQTSIGQLVRAAVEAYLPQLEKESAGQLEMPILPASGGNLASAAGDGAPRRRKRQRPARPDRRRLSRRKRRGPMTRNRKG
jgi:predicted DNA-binding protein